MDREAIIDALERCFQEVIRRAPDTVVEDTPELLRILTPSRATVYYNSIFRARFADGDAGAAEGSGTGGAPAERRVAELVAEYRARGLPLRWHLGPRSQPARLLDLISAQRPDAIRLSHGLALECADFRRARPAGEITIEPLTEANLEELVTTEGLAWGIPTPERAAIVREQAREALAAPERWRFHVARAGNGEAVGAGRLLVFRDGSAGYFAGGGVVPAWRRRGVYGELVSARLELLRELGVKLALVHALRSSSSPGCQARGFRVYVDSAVVEFASPGPRADVGGGGAGAPARGDRDER